MTIGIYKLNFNGTNKVYIGKSDNIEIRYSEHIRKLRAENSPYKIQSAYNKYGNPVLEIVLECGINELLDAEKEAIDIWDAVANGFNHLVGQFEECLGEDSPRAKHSNEVYYNILCKLITPHITYRDISEELLVSESIIRHIACLEKHVWMKDAYPDKYAQLEHIYNTSSMRRGGMRGIPYPDICSPNGGIFKVVSPTSFAIEHNLSQSALSQVLNSKRKSHKGWKLAAA